MKRTLIIAASIALVATPFASANLLVNPSFESPGGAGFPPADNWDSSATAEHAVFTQPGNAGLGNMFAFLNGDVNDARKWTLQVTSSMFEADTEYVFSGYAVDGTGLDGGEINFELGYLTDMNDLNTFQSLSIGSYTVTGTWTEYAGTTYTPAAGNPEIGETIIARITASDLTPGGDDIWFDEMYLTPEPTSLMLLGVLALLRRR